MNVIIRVTIVLSFIFNISVGLEFKKQHRYNPNTDFLIHEGANSSPSKNSVGSQSQILVDPSKISQGNKQTSENRDYDAQFPVLGSSSRTPVQSTVSSDSIGPSSTAHKHNTQLSSGKRDYVSPQFTTVKPSHVSTQTTGKVKDLINYYDNKGKDQNGPHKMPSYSSILQGGKQPSSIVTTASSINHTPLKSDTQTTKSSSTSITPGSNKPSSPSLVTSKPMMPHSTSTKIGAGNIRNTTPIPGKPILPSSIVNNNNNKIHNLNGVSDEELQTLSEELLRKDINNAAKYITVNYQEKTTSQSKEDKAPLPLLVITSEAWNISTVQKFVPLLDNYERDTLVNEYITPQERNEENAFMDAIMQTTVIRHLMNFLKDKGFVTPDPKQQRDFLKQLWFSMYSRGKGKISSSGFEHIFVSELKNNEVSGLHNWIYFAKEESMNRVNYLGYLKYVLISDKGAVLKLHFSQEGVDKPVDSLFIGTSPELEIALYTLCFITRADNECKLKLGTKDVDIVTHTFRYRSKNLIGSAYPQI